MVLKRRGRDDGAIWAWNKALEAEPLPSQTLDDLTQLFYEEAVETGSPEYLRPHPLDSAARAAERLRRQPGWESRGDMMLGLVCRDNLDLTGAAEAFRRVIDRDPNVAESNPRAGQTPQAVRPDLPRAGRPAEARPHLQSILARGPDPEASWLLSRVYLQQGAIAEAREALARAGSYRGDNPLEDEPSPYVGEARCQTCHAAIFQGLARQPAHPDLLPRGAASGAPPPGPAPGRSHRPQGHARDQGGRRRAFGGDARRRHRAPFDDRVCVRDERPLPDDGQP